MTTPTAMVSHLSKSFGAVRAVEDVSFEVYPGEIFGLLGPNGAGKTTSIRMMLDIFNADRGEISVLGGKMDEAKKNRIGYLPEERGLYKDLKLEPTLIFLARLKGLERSRSEAPPARLAEAARSVRSPLQESAGTQQGHAAESAGHRHAAARTRS